MLAILLVVIVYDLAVAQPFHGESHLTWPSDIELRSYTGTVLVDASLPHEMYYLDEDGDGEAEYHLAFGPWWYQPASGATRPEDGSTATVTASLRNGVSPPTLIVFELDGETWRESVEVGMNGWMGMPLWTSSGDTLTVSGTALVDTTYFYTHYYLDVDNDSIPEYHLGFGPEWYEPTSGAVRPESGESIVVFGVLHPAGGLGRLIVYEIDGLTWRSPEGPAPWGGSWMQVGHTDSTFVYCVNDSANWITFPPGHMGGMGHMGGRRWPDSMFVQFWRVPADSLPGEDHSGRFAGFYMNVQDPTGSSMMDGSHGVGMGMMSFGGIHGLRLHYDHDELLDLGYSENDIQVWAWDEIQQWTVVENVTFDRSANAALVLDSVLSTYYALGVTSSATSAEALPLEVLPNRVALLQNYPNPFNPTTTISFELLASEHVVLSVFDLLGRKVTTLVDEVRPAGLHRVVFHAANRPSGAYVYRVEAAGKSYSRRMLLVE